MEIHKPKPSHNWREFLVELGTITLGVLIALAAEQTAQTLHNRSRAAEARANIRAEIAQNLGLMNWREDTEACQARRMTEVDGLIAASSAGKLPQEVLWIGQPVAGHMADGRYKAALQSGALTLFDAAEQEVYANLYGAFATHDNALDGELQAWADLRTLEDHPNASATLDWQLRSAMKRARQARWALDLNRALSLRQAAQIGVQPTPMKHTSTPSLCMPLHTPRAEAIKNLGNGSGNDTSRFP
ncbi:MAG TPA: hypothetical protein VFI23_11740 [Rhizomicrobium sp.]|nr:hypothetical protein [Rhizomicrobium sp.]